MKLIEEANAMQHGNFNFKETPIKDLKVIETKVFGDERGFFLETFNKIHFREAGIPTYFFTQDNHSYSISGTLRGLHFQFPSWQGKLVRVTKGKVYDVAVDLRKDSPTFGKWYGVELDAEKKNMFWIPEGFAHGFLALEDSEFIYKCTGSYKPSEEYTLKYNDEEVGINWSDYFVDYHINYLKQSDKDRSDGILLEDIKDML